MAMSMSAPRLPPGFAATPPKDDRYADEERDWTSMASKVDQMPQRYALMRECAAKRMDAEGGEGLGLYLSTPSNLGPGSYKSRDRWQTIAQKSPNLPPIRSVPGPGPKYAHDPPSFQLPPTAQGELNGATLDADARHWVKHADGRRKGVLIGAPPPRRQIRRVRSSPAIREPELEEPPREVVLSAVKAGWQKVSQWPPPPRRRSPEPPAGADVPLQEAPGEGALPPEPEPERPESPAEAAPLPRSSSAAHIRPPSPDEEGAKLRPRSPVRVTELKEVYVLKFMTDGSKLVVNRYRNGYGFKDGGLRMSV